MNGVVSLSDALWLTTTQTPTTMLLISGATRVEQVVGVIDSRPHPLRLINVGTAPITILDLAFDADWVSYGLITPSVPTSQNSAPSAAPVVPGVEAERQLYQLILGGRHLIQPGDANAWLVRLYWDGTHPNARDGVVRLTLTLKAARDTETRELSFHVSLRHLPVFEGLFALDWGDANLRGAYSAREAFNPKPIAVLIGKPTTRDLNGASGRADATGGKLGTRATLYLGNVQDKFAPVVAIDERAEIDALTSGPTHVPNLVRNLKRYLAMLPPYGGLTLEDLGGVASVIEDRYSANAFSTQSYEWPQLARLLIETTMASLAQTPRRIWDEDGTRQLTLGEPLGLISDVVLTHPPLMPKPVRQALRQWFRDGGLNVAPREWDELTARALHAVLGFAHERGGRLENVVRRFGQHLDLLVVDVGATTTRLGRLAIDITLPNRNPTLNSGIAVRHAATVQSQTFTGERLLLAVFRLLKLKLAALLASEAARLGDQALTPAIRAAAAEMLTLIQSGRVGTWLASAHDDLPLVVDQLVPTKFRDQVDEAPHRHFTLLVLLATRVLEAFSDGHSEWTPQTPSAGPSLMPLLVQSAHSLLPGAQVNEATLAALRISTADVVTQIRPHVQALAKVIRKTLTLKAFKHEDQPTPPTPSGQANDDVQKVRLSYAKGFDPAAFAPASTPTGNATPKAAAEDLACEPWLLLGGGTLVPDFVRQLLLDLLTVRDDAGAGHVAPNVWPEPVDEAASVALGACEAEVAAQAGVIITTTDPFAALPFDIGVRTDRFTPVFPRGTPLNTTASVKLGLEPSFPLMLWYRYLDAVDPVHVLGSFDVAPTGDTAANSGWWLNLVVTDSVWTLELSREPLNRVPNAPSIKLRPATPVSPLEWSLYSGLQ